MKIFRRCTRFRRDCRTSVIPRRRLLLLFVNNQTIVATAVDPIFSVSFLRRRNDEIVKTHRLCKTGVNSRRARKHVTRDRFGPASATRRLLQVRFRRRDTTRRRRIPANAPRRCRSASVLRLFRSAAGERGDENLRRNNNIIVYDAGDN